MFISNTSIINEDLPIIETLPELLDFAAKMYPENIAFRYREEGIKEITYSEFRKNVLKISKKLIDNGYKGKHMGIFATNSYNWISVFMAIIYSGNIAIPFDKDMPKEMIRSLVDENDIELIIYDNDSKHRIEYIDEITIPILSFDSFLKDIDRFESNDLKIFKSDVEKDDIAVIAFTSGTTGKTKAVMLSNWNLCASMQCTVGMAGIIRDCSNIAILPPHHIYQLSTTFYYFYCGGTFSFIKHTKDFIKDVKEFKPTCLTLVPFIIEMLYKYLKYEIHINGWSKDFEESIMRSNKLLEAGIDNRRIIFKKYLDIIGGNLRMIHCGGAESSEETIEFFNMIGIDIFVGYGITECSPTVSSNKAGETKIGSVGKPVDKRYCQVKLDNGEIVVKGDIVSKGYYNNPESNIESYRDGWFHTGDLGRFDEEGYLYITGRIKNLIVLNNAEMVSPEEVEKMINKHKLIKESLIYLNKSKVNNVDCIFAKIVPDEQYLSEVNNLNIEIDKIINEVNSMLLPYKRIIGYEIISEDLKRNATGKICR